jgi:hypothetical protein
MVGATKKLYVCCPPFLPEFPAVSATAARARWRQRMLRKLPSILAGS